MKPNRWCPIHVPGRRQEAVKQVGARHYCAACAEAMERFLATLKPEEVDIKRLQGL